MVGWHPCLNGHEFEQTPGDGEEQGSLECCTSWSCKELITAQQLKSNKFLQELQKQNKKRTNKGPAVIELKLANH